MKRLLRLLLLLLTFALSGCTSFPGPNHAINHFSQRVVSLTAASPSAPGCACTPPQRAPTRADETARARAQRCGARPRRGDGRPCRPCLASVRAGGWPRLENCWSRLKAPEYRRSFNMAIIGWRDHVVEDAFWSEAFSAGKSSRPPAQP